MSPGLRPAPHAMRLARRAWALQYLDVAASVALAERALAASGEDRLAQGWSRLTLGYHRMRHRSPTEGLAEFGRAQATLAEVADRRGELLALAGRARCCWAQGQAREGLAIVAPLRDEALRTLRHDELAVVLNTVAGCHSALGEAEMAFAYLFQALRSLNPRTESGYDAVIYCNLAHELYHLGDYLEALRHLDVGIARCAGERNPRLLGVLLLNRVVCLTDLARPAEALADIQRLLALPADAVGRDTTAFEAMAIAAVRAGRSELGEHCVNHALGCWPERALAEKRLELAVAEAEVLRARGAPHDAAMRLERELPLPQEGLSLRERCLLLALLADLHQQLGHEREALAHLRTWQALHSERSLLASRARFQAASLQTELLELSRERDVIDARRRAAQRARDELQALNQRLNEKVNEVQALQAELREQALRDGLTGLFNRRHLNNMLPAMHAMAMRDGQPLSAAIIDLDHFKQVNDQHGHPVGDRVLQAFGALLAARMRKSDVACRYGGEEFCVLMPRTGRAAAARKVRALLREWRKQHFDLGDGVALQSAFSAGVADSAGDSAHASWQALLRRADDAALAAKRSGRGRVVEGGGAEEQTEQLRLESPLPSRAVSSAG